MDNNLRKLEKDLRAMVKRCKNIKYTKSLLLIFLLVGILSFSVTVKSSEIKNVENSISQTRKQLNTSISNKHTKFKEQRQENDKLIKSANMELIQLMEEGDYVIKSPWSSWQFGIGKFTYSKWNGKYKGENNKRYF